jgi:hypothetical protein
MKRSNGNALEVRSLRMELPVFQKVIYGPEITSGRPVARP